MGKKGKRRVARFARGRMSDRKGLIHFLCMLGLMIIEEGRIIFKVYLADCCALTRRYSYSVGGHGVLDSSSVHLFFRILDNKIHSGRLFHCIFETNEISEPFAS
jgi:hypothetical protein